MAKYLMDRDLKEDLRKLELEKLNFNQRVELVNELYKECATVDYPKKDEESTAWYLWDDYKVIVNSSFKKDSLSSSDKGAIMNRIFNNDLSYEFKMFCNLIYKIEVQRVKEKLPVAILNTSILTSEGEFALKEISLEEAKELVGVNETISAVGHQSTADILTTLLKKDVPVNRIMFAQEKGQKALVFKLNGRPEEGKILTAEEINEIGYKFQLLEKIDD